MVMMQQRCIRDGDADDGAYSGDADDSAYRSNAYGGVYIGHATRMMHT
jgi:hypothetical protein